MSDNLGELRMNLHRLTKNIGATRHRLAHPEKYTKSGKYSKEQRDNLRATLDRLVGERAEARDALSARPAGDSRMRERAGAKDKAAAPEREREPAAAAK